MLNLSYINDKKEMPRLEDAPWYEKVLNAAGGAAESSVGAGIMYSSMDSYRRDKIKSETPDIDNGKLKEEGKELDKKIKEVEKGKSKGSKSGKKTIISTVGNEIDVTPSSNHTSVNKNPGPYGEANSSVDILDADGNIKTRRWYDSDGRAYRDVDMSDHGNPKEHPEVPHEHTWEYKNGKLKRN